MSGYQGQLKGARFTKKIIAIVICLVNAGCLVDPGNPEITLMDHQSLFFDFHGDPEICLSVNRIELTTKYRTIVMQKLYLMRKQKSGS